MAKNPLSKYLAINPNQILKFGRGKVYLGGNIMPKEEFKILQAEVKYIEKTKFWEIITNYIPEQAKQIMFEKSTTFDDMKTGKAMLYNLDLIIKLKNIIKAIKLEENPVDKSIIINKELG